MYIKIFEIFLLFSHLHMYINPNWSHSSSSSKFHSNPFTNYHLIVALEDKFKIIYQTKYFPFFPPDPCSILTLLHSALCFQGVSPVDHINWPLTLRLPVRIRERGVPVGEDWKDNEATELTPLALSCNVCPRCKSWFLQGVLSARLALFRLFNVTSPLISLDLRWSELS